MYYTYLWLREDGTPYYVGKGRGKRAYSKNHRHTPPPMGRVVFYIAKDEDEAFENEISLIWYYGRKDLGTGCLRNLTDGGENPPKGSRKGLPVSVHTRNKISVSLLGRQPAIETREKQSGSAMGNKNSPGWPKGKLRSAENKSKLREAAKEMWRKRKCQ